MPTRDEYLKRPLAERLGSLARAPDELAVAIRGQTAAALHQRPGGAGRAPGGVPSPPGPRRGAEDRQYHRNDPHEALTAFGRRRREVLALLGGLSAEQWRRGGIHPEHGRFSFEAWIAGMAGHDDNHLDQLRRAHGSRLP